MSLYETLSVPRDASGAEIKKAYLRQARDTHPDKHPDDPEATERFQALGRAYAILRDEAKRTLYDETGLVDDEVGLNKDGAPWEAFWRDFYSRVTLDKLDALKASYRDSDEELGDLKKAYRAAKGDMEQVMNEVMLCTAEDEPRFREILERLVAAGELPKYKAFSREPDAKRRKRQQRAEREAAEAEEAAKELGLARLTQGGGSGEDGLRAALAVRQQAREQQFDSLISTISERHAGGKAGDKKAAAATGARKGKAKSSGAPLEDPLSDAAFEAAQARMMARRNK